MSYRETEKEDYGAPVHAERRGLPHGLSSCARMKLPSLRDGGARGLSRPLDEYACLHQGRNNAMAAAYRSGGYTLQQIGTHFGVHYLRVSRIIQSLRDTQAKGKL